MHRTRHLFIAVVLFAGTTIVAAQRLMAEDSAKPSQTTTAASGGIDAQKLAEIAPRMREFVEQKKVAGVVTLVAHHGKVVHLDAVGEADIDGHKPMSTDSVFAIASMTKPVTAAAVMILQDEGKLSVDDPVSKYIPEFKDVTLNGSTPEHQLMLHHVLTHTALTGDQQNMGTLEETAKKLAQRPLAFDPGSKWQYGPGLSVAGRVVEVVSGQPFEKFLEERIFGPLKMDETTFHPTKEQQDRLARLYEPSDDKQGLKPGTHWLTDTSPEKSPNPSGGLFSTAEDMAQFYMMMANKGEWQGQRILSEKAVEQMTTIQTGDLTTGFTDGNGWGFGWCVVRKPQGVTGMLSPGTFGHGGAFGTQGWIDPKREMAFVLMIQRSGFGNGDDSDLRRALQETAVAALKE